MPSTDAITLKLTASGIDNYCRELTRRLPTLEKRVTAMDTLTTFILTQTDVGEQVKSEFAAIRHVLLDHFEQAREALLNERAQRLHQALRGCNLAQVAALYTSLSRDAFWTLLRQVEQQLDAGALNALRDWASSWLLDTQERARQVSPFPDAIDLKAAGIDAAEYLAMTDLCRYLGIET